MKKLLLLLFITITSFSGIKAQCPIGAFALKSTYAQCGSGCGVLLIGWPSGVLVNIYGGTPLNIITSAVITGTLGSGTTGNAFVCVPCNVPLVFASSATGATSGCVIADVGTVPVKLSGFAAVSSATRASSLKWTGSNEIAGIKYIVQRAADGRNFSDLSTIIPENNGKDIHTYSFNDESTLPGNNYYRIKAVEITGNITYTETVLIKKQNDFSVSVYPNPVVNNFKVSLPKKFLPATLEVVNAQGQTVYSAKTQQETTNISKAFQKGVYALKVTAADNSTVTQKIVKE
ncbi:MAG: T9SS type A sorting domain-containing protein [Ferruginibacter sp.]